MKHAGHVTRSVRQLGLGIGLGYSLIFEVWSAPVTPGYLPVKVQAEFSRLYDLPDAGLKVQLSTALDRLPRYRQELLAYLGESASVRRQLILSAFVDTPVTAESVGFWVNSTTGAVSLATVLLGGAAIAQSGRSGSAGRSHVPRPDDLPGPLKSVQLLPEPVVFAQPAKVPDPVKDVHVQAPEPAPVLPIPEPTPELPAPKPVPALPIPIPASVVPLPKPGAVPVELDPGLILARRQVYRTKEFIDTMALTAIKADYAYARGGSGEGIVISIQDRLQVDGEHPEIVGQIAPGSMPGTTEVTESHATKVARVALGAKNDQNFHGLAFGAKALTYTATQTFTEIVGREIAHGARVSNRSFHLPELNAQVTATRYGSIFQSGVDAGIVYVFAGGNTPTETQPTGFSTMPLHVPGLKPLWLVAVAVDLNPDMTGAGRSTAGTRQGNPCASAKEWCLAAPGFAFQIPIDDFQSYKTMTYSPGSSYAAPLVSGSVAILMELFPTLSSAQVVQRVLVSADKTGIYADQEQYGQGLLNLDAATRPIGALRLESATGEVLALSQAAIAEGPAFGNAMKTSLADVDLVVKDSLSAPFLVKGDIINDARLHADAQVDTTGYLQRMEHEYASHQFETASGLRVMYQGTVVGSDLAALGDVRATQRLGDNWVVSAGLNTDPSWSQGLMQAKAKLREASTTQAFANPFLSLNSLSSGAGLRLNLNQNWYTSVQAQQARAVERLVDRPSQDYQRSVQSEWGYTSLSGFSARLQTGVLQEDQRLLGTQGHSLLAGSAARTLFGGVDFDWAVTPDWTLYGRYNQGHTRQKGSGWAAKSDLRSDSFTVGMLGQPTEQFQVGVLAFQPLRMSHGNISAMLPTQLHADNRVGWHRTEVRLKAEGRHLEYEAFARYDLPVYDASLKGSLLRIEDYQNQSGNDDVMLMLSGSLKF